MSQPAPLSTELTAQTPHSKKPRGIRETQTTAQAAVAEMQAARESKTIRAGSQHGWQPLSAYLRPCLHCSCSSPAHLSGLHGISPILQTKQGRTASHPMCPHLPGCTNPALPPPVPRGSSQQKKQGVQQEKGERPKKPCLKSPVGDLYSTQLPPA